MIIVNYIRIQPDNLFSIFPESLCISKHPVQKDTKKVSKSIVEGILVLTVTSHVWLRTRMVDDGNLWGPAHDVLPQEMKTS